MAREENKTIVSYSPIVAILCLLSVIVSVFSQINEPGIGNKNMMKDRKHLAQRPRRIIYNDDGCNVKPYRTAEELISLRVKQVANTQTDMICYCTGGGGLFWGHQPQVGEALGEFADERVAVHEDYVKDINESLECLKKAGTDPLSVTVEFGHKNGMEVFWSYRMNNAEDSFAPWSLARRKREHGDYLMGVKADWEKYPTTDPRAWWSAYDFAVPEVRDYIVRIFEDVCQRYDIDGIELDFIRHPMFFRPNLDDLPAEPQHVAMMTDLVRRIRAVTERVALDRGRPLLVSVRAPLSVESSLAIGLDIPTYLKEGLMDILIAGQDYVQMAVACSLRDMVDLGHNHHVQVYALLSPPHQYMKKPSAEYLQAWRGAAMNRWYWGADGIYTFNLFPTEPDECFSQIGSVGTLKGLDKIYGIDHLLPETVLGSFRLSLVMPNRLPIALTPNNNVTAKLPVGEDIIANTPAGKTACALLRLEISSLLQGDQITIKLNGHLLKTPDPVEPLTTDPASAEYHLDIDPKLVQAGYNLIDINLITDRVDKQASVLEFLDLVVSYE